MKKRGTAAVLGAALLLSALCAVSGKLLFLALLASALLLGTAILPEARGRENCVMFALLAVSSVPADLYLVYSALNSELVWEFSEGKTFVLILMAPILYAVLFSVEQIVMGVVVRLIWPRQSVAEIKVVEPGEECE